MRRRFLSHLAANLLWPFARLHSIPSSLDLFLVQFRPPQYTPQSVVGEKSVEYLQVGNAYRYLLALAGSMKVGALVVLTWKNRNNGFRAGKTTYLWHKQLIRIEFTKLLIGQVKVKGIGA